LAVVVVTRWEGVVGEAMTATAAIDVGVVGMSAAEEPRDKQG